MVIGETQRWTPGIGDATVMGWVTVAAYAFAVLLCLRCARLEQPSKAHRSFWWFLACVLAALGLNKQLDLQTLLTQLGRDLAIAQGWYEERRKVQMALIALLAAFGLGAHMVVFQAVRKLGSEVRWAVAGLVCLMVFIIVRATSFHHVDLMLHLEIGGWRLNWILELGGIACITLAVLRRLRTLSTLASST
jgi:hypothetical protein